MKEMSVRPVFAVLLAALALVGLGASSSVSQPRIDDGYYVTYHVASQGHAIAYTTCEIARLGGGGNGCLNSGVLRRFEQPCAIMEGGARINANVVTREIYVLDRRATTTDPVLLSVFRRRDTYGRTSLIRTKVDLVITLPLGFAAGPQAHCFMAANREAVYAGTDASGKLAAIDKATFTIQRLDFQSTEKLTYMTGGDRGYVAIGASNGFILIAPDGVIDRQGGGVEYTLNNHNAVTLNVPP
jgi:hypothetical protein